MAGGHGHTIVQQISSPNDDIIGGDIQLDATHDSALRETEGHLMKQKCRNNYCCRIIDMIAWIRVNYPTYYTTGVVKLTPEQEGDKLMFGMHTTQTHDLIYNRLNVKMIKAFMSANRFKLNGKEYGFDHTRKYKDAVKYGAKRAKQPLPQNFDIEMLAYMQSLNKQKTTARKNGREGS